MTTLALLKSRIADDIVRTDLTTQIGQAISDAIKYYQRERLYFNESRSYTFNTVASQSIYTSSDDADIGLIQKVDMLHLTDDGERYWLCREDPKIVEYLNDGNATETRPDSWAWFDRSIMLYPIPDAAYTVRILGHFVAAEPTTDGEAGNVWMTEAFELLRCRAKLMLAVHVLRDNDLAQVMKMAENEELAKLRGETARKVGTGIIRGSGF